MKALSSTHQESQLNAPPLFLPTCPYLLLSAEGPKFNHHSFRLYIQSFLRSNPTPSSWAGATWFLPSQYSFVLFHTESTPVAILVSTGSAVRIPE
jgi:hypothetical protein